MFLKRARHFYSKNSKTIVFNGDLLGEQTMIDLRAQYNAYQRVRLLIMPFLTSF